MSLVDYASSSDDEDTEVRENEAIDEPQVPKDDSAPTSTLPHTRRSGLPSNEELESDSNSLSSMEKLPDASLLLNSPTVPAHLLSGSDHSSRVAAAMAESESRKREANRSAFSLPRSKVPRGTLPHSKNVPDTEGGLLVPPQLRGRSNVVTEDIGKLFVRRQSNPSSH